MMIYEKICSTFPTTYKKLNLFYKYYDYYIRSLENMCVMCTESFHVPIQ